jgi:hypothetical protein
VPESTEGLPLLVVATGEEEDVLQQGISGGWTRIYFHATVEPPLDLGLSISLASPTPWLRAGGALGAGDVPGSAGRSS